MWQKMQVPVNPNHDPQTSYRMGYVRRKKNKEYYAVFSGRVEEPTIFSSWGDAHPLVTGCPATHKSFFTIEQAREYMAGLGAPGCKEIIKVTALQTTPEWNSMAYYAVAHGAHPGIREVWYGSTGALKEIREISGACHKRFRTKDQAEAFIEDWKQSFINVWNMEIRKALDQGYRPQDMKLSTQGILQDTKVEDITKQLDKRLTLD